MKALYIESFGDENVLKYGDLPAPSYLPNSALVKISYCALNHLDLWVRKGLPGYEISFPHILGSDISGEVVESDERSLYGKKVILYPAIGWCKSCEFCLRGEVSLCKNYSILGFQFQGGYAEYIRVPVENLFLLPEHLSLEEGACIPLTLTTVSRMLFSQVNIKPYHSVLVMGGGSG
ncbi:MAG: alcohol dehydrogenase catalytic domain-containing protein, partial [Planctomycetota bacterium]